jgi:cytochrome P450
VSVGAPSGSLHDELGALLGKRQDALADPYRLYSQLRETAPVFRHEPVVVLSRYEDIMWVFRNEQRFHVNGAGEGRRYEAILASLPEPEAEALREVTEFERLYVSRTDGEVHARLRRIAHRAFTPRRVTEMEAQIERYSDALLDAIDHDAPVDLIEGLTFRLPLMVIADMLGVPAADRDLIHTWSSVIGRNRGGTEREAILPARQALREFRDYVSELVRDHRGRPGEEDLVAALLDANADERLSEVELTAMFVILLFAGHETTTNLIGNGLIALLRAPDQWRSLCEDPAGLAPGAVEEVLRYDAPVQIVNRVAAQDIELAGVTIAAEETVLLALASANRDVTEFRDPDQLELTRSPNRHVGLAYGTHFCLGASLARMEGRVALETLARRFPDAQLATDEFIYNDNFVLRGVRELPVQLGRSRS